MIFKNNFFNSLSLTFFMALMLQSFSLPFNDGISKSATDQNPKVKMTFDKESINIGKVKRGETRKFDFVFTNTGTDDIEIDIVSGCDCTTLDWPRKAVKPGQKGVINVSFDSTKKEDSETIDIDIYLKNLNPKTGQRILKIVNYTYELTK
ncbi:MAG: DUF1573 domain-containing protein [Saprospiraceae bacterium]|nr:DUF1573 domain-containing protein [Saprospiraceae bacterium]